MHPGSRRHRAMRRATYSGALLLGLILGQQAVAAEGGLEEAVLEVRVNETDLGESLVVLRGAQGRLLLASQDFQRLRLKLPTVAPVEQDGQRWYAPADTPGTNVSIDEAHQRALITAPAASFATTRLDAPARRGPQPTPAAPGTFLNYQLTSQQVAGTRVTGAFTELGPIRITKNRTGEFGSSWNIIGHTLFIDQPIGVGFSYNRDTTKPLVNSARQAADHLLNFLFNLYKQWPSLKTSPLYITGESFAGHYIPAFGSKIVNNNSFLSFTGITLEGVAIGDGWTDPMNQINFYDSYLYSVGVVSNKFRDTCTWFQTQAIQNIMLGTYRNVPPSPPSLWRNLEICRSLSQTCRLIE